MHYRLFMLNTTQNTTSTRSEVISTSRGFGRAAARTKVGAGAHVIHAALKAARLQFPQCDADAFTLAFQAERRAMRG